MCGIAGIIGESDPDNRLKTVKRMISRISYRGPDECGIYHSQKATIGNARLSIIDIPEGQQPLSDTSGKYWIVFNGEIFNYIELRKNLEKKGYQFNTSSDTEVLVQIYAVYGKKCLKLLNGQFAFAIWDKTNNELFIARDRVGIRPLFYHYNNGLLTFASEIKSLFENAEIPRVLSSHELQQVYTFWATITPNTVFKDIRELSPGHYLVFNNAGLTVRKYWEQSYSVTEYRHGLSNYLEEFHDLFYSAVRIRLRADVEVAAYLSGGLDSSATVSYIKEIEPHILNTFSIKFDEKEFDESQFQDEAVKYFNTHHTSIRCSSVDIARRFPDVVWYAEMPMTRTAPAPMLMLSELVRQKGIKVVITGEGADEMLAGYNIFKESEVRRFWSRNPSSKFRPLLLSRLYPYLPQMDNVDYRILKMFYGYKLSDTNNPYYSHLLRWNNGRQITKYFSDGSLKQNHNYDPINEIDRIVPGDFATWDPIAQSQWIETSVFMSGYLLSSQGDRMAMANSVEGRYPFLDHRLIEFLAKVPSNLKLKGLQEKYLLKKLIKGKIPESILIRSKQAYRAPITSVFFSNNMPEYVNYMLSQPYLDEVGIFNSKQVSSLLKKIRTANKGSELENMALIAILSTQLLHYFFIDRNSPEVNENILKHLKLIIE